MSRRTLLTLLAMALLLSPLAAAAQVTLTVSTPTVHWNNSAPVRVTVSGLTSSEAHLRLYVDVAANGTYEAGSDYLVWSTVGRDNVAEWSPVMFSDQNPAVGTVALDLGPVSPFRYPHTAGSYLFIAQDGPPDALPAGPVSAYVPFTVTQTSESITVSGQVRDPGGAYIAGAIVFLMPLGNNGFQNFDGIGEDWERWGPSCVANAAGNYTLNVPAAFLEAGACTERLVLAIKPGYMTQLLLPAQPRVVLETSASGQNPVLRLGSVFTGTSGQVTYSSGPRAGSGIPGALVFGVSEDGPPEFTVAMTDTLGQYEMPLSAHPINGTARFGIHCWDPLYLAFQGAVGVDEQNPLEVIATAPTTADLSYAAADAFITGTLRDPGGSALGAGYLVHAKDLLCMTPTPPYPCNSYRTNGLTGSSGTFTLGVVGGTGGTQAVLLNRAYIPADQIATAATCVSVASGGTASQDISLWNPTLHVAGAISREDGTPVKGLQVRGTTYPSSCLMANSRAFTGCDGTYSLPATAATWTVEVEPGQVWGAYAGYDEAAVTRTVSLTGNVSGANFIMGRWEIRPTLSDISPPSGYDGAALVIRGVGLSLGSAPTAEWTDQISGATTAATVLAFRPELGELWLAAPSADSGDGTPFSVMVTNTDLGWLSNPVCYTALGAAPDPCTLTGTVTELATGTPVANALVKVVDSSRQARGLAVTAVDGTYSVTLPQTGSTYSAVFYPPDFGTFALATYGSVVCGGVRDHAFTTGSQVQGRITDDGDGLTGSALELVFPSGGSVRAVADMDGYFGIQVPSATGYTARFVGPPTSHFITQRQTGVDLSADRDFGEVSLSQGVVLVGKSLTYGLTLTDYGYVGGRRPAPRVVEVYRTSDNAFAGRSASGRAETCQGAFAVAFAPGTSVRLELTDSNPNESRATVQPFTLTWDTFAEFDFPVFQQAGPTTPEPRFGRDLKTHGQPGSVVDIWGTQFGAAPGEIMPSFFDSNTGYIYGDDVVSDPDRGVIFTRVPLAADTDYLDLELAVGADFYYSDSFPFAIDAGTFTPGAYAVSGTVTSGGGPVAGAVVVILWQDVGEGDADAHLLDYAVTDALGAYSATMRAGNGQVVVFPPVSLGLASALRSLEGVSGAVVADFALQAGSAVQVTVRDSLGAPIPWARVSVDGDGLGYETRLTDASGVAVLPLLAGTYQMEVLGPEKDRFLEYQTTLVVTGAASLSVTLPTGRMVTLRAVDPDGVPMPRCEGWTNLSTSPYTEYGWTFSRDAGILSAPVASGQAFNWYLEPPYETPLAALWGTESATTVDVVKYPSVALGYAGYIAGTVTDQGTAAPLPDIPVRAYPQGNPDQNTAWALTAANGTYQIKVGAGSYALAFNDVFGMGDDAHAAEYYSEVFCDGSSSPVAVTTGATTTANEALNPGGVVSGSVYNGNTNAPLPGASALAYSTALGSCSPVGQGVGSDGVYRLRLPSGSYQMQGAATGFSSQCWDHFNSCPTYTAVTVTAGSSSPNIDFDLGTAPGEVASTGTYAMRVVKGTGADAGKTKVTFQAVSGAGAYNLYGFTGFRTNVSPLESQCLLTPGVTAGLVDNGNGTYTYTYTPSSSVRSLLVTASNRVTEGTLGNATSGSRDSGTWGWRCGNSPR